MKLLYLAERESLLRYGTSITNDAFVSMPHGPVLSMTLDCINGFRTYDSNCWNTWIADREENHLVLATPGMIRSTDDLRELSESDVEALDSVWKEYGYYSATKLRDITHSSFCPEWEDPKGYSKPISMKKLLTSIGYNDSQANSIIQNMQVQSNLAESFQSCL
ncbi:Panacea domain-containing protein [Taylorella equigenitalis]|uniref:Panacea domain-containing protein n=1 Tax=Taylorella equigenitalis TaxID=29575 RepID=UPI00237E2594|nr:Panacea domain-containing protein [Taylorella equigenitalis]WDU52139.1 SocA family protein [Taylorella equigenitalis]